MRIRPWRCRLIVIRTQNDMAAINASIAKLMVDWDSERARGPLVAWPARSMITHRYIFSVGKAEIGIDRRCGAWAYQLQRKVAGDRCIPQKCGSIDAEVATPGPLDSAVAVWGALQDQRWKAGCCQVLHRIKLSDTSVSDLGTDFCAGVRPRGQQGGVDKHGWPLFDWQYRPLWQMAVMPVEIEAAGTGRRRTRPIRFRRAIGSSLYRKGCRLQRG